MPGTLAKGRGKGITDRFSSKISLWFETFPFREKEVDKTAEPMKSFSAIPPSGRSDPHDPYPSAAEAVAVARTSGLTDSDSAFMGCLAA